MIFSKQRASVALSGLGIVAVAVALRLLRMQHLTMWSDEYHTIRVILLPLQEILAGHYVDWNPPLYGLLLHLFVRVFGESEVVLRAFSLAFSILALPLSFLLARQVTGRTSAGLAMLAIFAFHPIFINYAVEIRPYSLLILLSLVSYVSYLQLRQARGGAGKWAVVLGAALTGCLYVHYLGCLVLLSILTCALLDWSERGQRRRAATMALASIFVSTLLGLPGLRLLVQQATILYPLGHPAPVPLDKSLLIFGFYLADRPLYEPLVTILSMLALSVGLILLVRSPTERTLGLWLAVSLALTIFVAVFAPIVDVAIFPRHLLGLAPLVFLPIASLVGVRRTGRADQLVHGLGLLVIFAYIVCGIDFVANTARENQAAAWKADWRAISQIISELRAPGERIVLTSWDATPIQYYLGEQALPMPNLVSGPDQAGAPGYLIITTPNSPPSSLSLGPTLVFSDSVELVGIWRLRGSASP